MVACFGKCKNNRGRDFGVARASQRNPGTVVLAEFKSVHVVCAAFRSKNAGI